MRNFVLYRFTKEKQAKFRLVKQKDITNLFRKKVVLISRHLTLKETIYRPIKNTKQIINFEDAYYDYNKVCYPELWRSDINFLPNFRFTMKHELQHADLFNSWCGVAAGRTGKTMNMVTGWIVFQAALMATCRTG